MEEFVVWGIPPRKDCKYCSKSLKTQPHETAVPSHETVLYEEATTLEQATKVAELLTTKHGVTKARIQVIGFYPGCEKDLAKMWQSPAMINMDY